MIIRIALLAFASLLPLVSLADVSPKTVTPKTVTAASAAAAPSNRTPRPTITIVNLNTADAATLARDMDGIGATKAQAIVEHRKTKGAFRSVDELALVKGIGSKTLERNRARLTVGAAAANPASPKPPRVTAATAGAGGATPPR